MCNGMMYNLFNRDSHLPHEGSVFALIGESAVVRTNSHLPTRGKKAATEETARCRDGSLSVMYFCGSFICSDKGDSHVTRYESNCCGRAGTADVFGRVPANGSGSCVRNFAQASGEDQAGWGSEAARRSDHPFAAASAKRLGTKPDIERGDWAGKSSCVGVGRQVLCSQRNEFALSVNRFQLGRQALSRDLRLCGEPVFVLR